MAVFKKSPRKSSANNQPARKNQLRGPESNRNKVTVLAYDERSYGYCRRFVPPNSPEFAKAIQRLSRGPTESWERDPQERCATNIVGVLEHAAHILRNMSKGHRHIYLLTDGQHNCGNDHRLPQIASECKTKGIQISTIGFGTPGDEHFDAGQLKIIANRSGGTYHDATSLDGLKRAFTASTKPAKTSGGRLPTATVYCIDISPSMSEQMLGKARVDHVVDTMYALANYQQNMWS